MTKNWKFIYFAYLGVVFLLNILPINGSSSSLNHVYVIHLRLDYWVHAVMFLPWMGISLLGVRAHSRLTEKPLYHKALLLIAGILFAIACECMQFFTAWRTFNINDLIANLSGVFVGIPLYFYVRHKITRPESPDTKK